jgi:chemotaxis protein MotB
VLRAELARVGAALEAAETATRDRDVQIANLGQRLNAALAQRVEELQSYRSDFFGRLRRVLGDRPEVRIVGDRFVFQSEVLFPAGSAELSEAGQQQIRNIGRVLQDIARQFPPDLNWVLRVDGHADRTPVRGGRFASNWELSSARAIAVAQLLIADGLAPNRVAATAFGDTQPLDERETPDAYARNRRIELRLEPVPVAPPAATQAPPDPRRAAREVLGALACARVTVTEEAGGLRVAGIARRGAEAELRAALQSRAAAGALANLDIRPFGEALCEVVEALRPVPIASGNSALRLQVVGAEPLPSGSLLRTDIVMPDWAGQLALFYIATDGQVVRLAVLDRQAAGARFPARRSARRLHRLAGGGALRDGAAGRHRLRGAAVPARTARGGAGAELRPRARHGGGNGAARGATAGRAGGAGRNRTLIGGAPPRSVARGAQTTFSLAGDSRPNAVSPTRTRPVSG